MSNRTLELKQQIIHRQIFAFTILGGSMMVLFGGMVALIQIG